MKELNTAWDNFINEFAKAIGVPKTLRYIISVLDYYKTRRRLNKGESCYDYIKISNELLRDENAAIKSITEEAFNIVIGTSVKYRIALDYRTTMAYACDDDFVKNIQTIDYSSHRDGNKGYCPRK